MATLLCLVDAVMALVPRLVERAGLLIVSSCTYTSRLGNLTLPGR